MVKLAKGRPHLSRSVVDTLLTQLHSSQDAARILMCHCLAAIAMQLPVLGDGMLGDLVELYKVIGRSATDKQQELLVRKGNWFVDRYLRMSALLLDYRQKADRLT